MISLNDNLLSPNLLSPRNRPHRDRNIAITRAYVVDGELVKDIAAEHGLSRTRITQIIHTAIRQHRFSRSGSKYPHWRLPDDIAAKLRDSPQQPRIAKEPAFRTWTPQEVEAETMAGYWYPWPGPVINAKLNAYWAKQRQYWTDFYDRQNPPVYSPSLAEYCRELDIELPK